MVITGSTLTKTIPMPSGPNKMALTADQSVLYVVCGNDDSVTAIDTATDTVKYKISLTRPGYPFKGANPDDVAVGPRGQTLFVTLGGENAVAVIDVASRSILGRIPVGWYPTSTRPSLDGKHLFVINEKSNAGPNPGQTYYSWKHALRHLAQQDRAQHLYVGSRKGRPRVDADARPRHARPPDAASRHQRQLRRPQR